MSSFPITELFPIETRIDNTLESLGNAIYHLQQLAKCLEKQREEVARILRG
jgi:hypothetical protein